MGTAYTPGLTISADAVVRKVRRLPLKGQVLVQVGDFVSPGKVIARTELPGPVTTVRVAEQLGVEPNELPRFLLKRVGEPVQAGEPLAERKSLWGLLTTRVPAPVSGTIEFVSETTGNLGIRHPPTPVEVTAYLQGFVVEVLPQEGAVIATRGTFIQGIFGLGGERNAPLALLARSPDETVSDSRLSDEHRGKALIVGAHIHWNLLEAARQVGAVALIAGSAQDSDLKRLLGYELGVAITGDEAIPFTLIITEGFGQLAMARRTFELLAAQEGKLASLNGATQIRAGVIRPEVIVPRDGLTLNDLQAPEEEPVKVGELTIGTPVRLIRAPYFGRLGRVVALPPEPQTIETETQTRVAEVELVNGERVIVPRANLEIFAHSDAS